MAVPDILLLRLPDDPHRARAHVATLPRTLLGHVVWHTQVIRSAEHLALELLAEPRPAGVASARLTHQAADLGQGDSQAIHHLCADPIHISLGRDHAYLDFEAAQSVTAAESGQLLLTLNRHFAPDGIEFFAHLPDARSASNSITWCARFRTGLQIRTSALAEALGKSVPARAPQGADAGKLRALETEIQMLLFEHPVNAERGMRGLLPVNSVWFWGEPEYPVTHKADDHRQNRSKTTPGSGATVNFCHAESPETGGDLAHLTNIPARLRPELIFVARTRAWFPRIAPAAVWRFWRAPDWRIALAKSLEIQVLGDSH